MEKWWFIVYEEKLMYQKPRVSHAVTRFDPLDFLVRQQHYLPAENEVSLRSFCELSREPTTAELEEFCLDVLLERSVTH